MKNTTLVLLVTLLINFGKTFSQTTTVIGGFNNPTMIAFSGNFLYLVNADKIQKVDVTLANPTAITVVSGLSSPQYLAIKDNFLYIAHHDKISKVNITLPTPTTATDVVTGIGFASGLCFSGNDLYISFFSAGKIAKIDTTQANPVLTNVITGISSPIAMIMVGNYLYFGSTVGTSIPAQGISKIDITQANPVMTTILTGVYDPKAFIINGNTLLFSELGANGVFKIDITQTNPVKTQIVEIPLGPFGIAIRNNILYVCELFAQRILKLDTPLSTNDINLINTKIKVFPNPTQEEINITGTLSSEHFTIYNLMGQEVIKGTMINNKIAVNNLINGIYYLKIGNTETVRFIKK